MPNSGDPVTDREFEHVFAQALQLEHDKGYGVENPHIKHKLNQWFHHCDPDVRRRVYEAAQRFTALHGGRPLCLTRRISWFAVESVNNEPIVEAWEERSLQAES